MINFGNRRLDWEIKYPHFHAKNMVILMPSITSRGTRQ